MFNKEDKGCIAVKDRSSFVVCQHGQSSSDLEKNITETEFDIFKYKLICINGFVGLGLSPFNSLYQLYLEIYENDILLKS